MKAMIAVLFLCSVLSSVSSQSPSKPQMQRRSLYALAYNPYGGAAAYPGGYSMPQMYYPPPMPAAMPYGQAYGYANPMVNPYFQSPMMHPSMLAASSMQRPVSVLPMARKYIGVPVKRYGNTWTIAGQPQLFASSAMY